MFEQILNRIRIPLFLILCLLISESHANHISFRTREISVTLDENSPVGTLVTTVRINGNDENRDNNVRYRISQGFDSHSDDEYFTIVESGDNRGQIKVAIPPDYETKSVLKIRVSAGHKGSGEVEDSIDISISIYNLDETDVGGPVFSYSGVENSLRTGYLDATKQSDQNIGRMYARGIGDIEYFVTKDPYGFFDIDKKTGILSGATHGSITIDDSTERTYTIQVGAKDSNNNWGYTDITIILDRPPVFTESVPIIRTIQAVSKSTGYLTSA